MMRQKHAQRRKDKNDMQRLFIQIISKLSCVKQRQRVSMSNDVPQVVTQTYYYCIIRSWRLASLLLKNMGHVQTTQSNYFMATGGYYYKKLLAKMIQKYF